MDRREHGRALIAQIESIQAGVREAAPEADVPHDLPETYELVLELDSAPGFPLSADEIEALTRGTDDIQVLHARWLETPDQQPFTKIILHVTYGSLALLAEKFRLFAEELTPAGNPRHAWAANLQRVGRAAFVALWTDTEPLPAEEELAWWQFWVRRAVGQEAFRALCEGLGVSTRSEVLTFPEHLVFIGQARRADLESSIELLNALAEVRRARPCNHEFTDLTPQEQQEWIDEAVQRIILPGENAPAVCLLDTGINRGHPLIAPLLAAQDNHTIFGDGDPSDGDDGDGHGTRMAGIAAYGDIRPLMLPSARWAQSHRLEGVRMFDETRPHEPQNYGEVTRQAVSLPEVSEPHRARVFSLPITENGPSTGVPSAWSAAIDSLAFGGEDENPRRRVIFVSAGNINAFEPDNANRYPVANEEARIESPAQAWNAITVGALTHRTEVREADPESAALATLAPEGGLSPHARTSADWDYHWPIKPDIVMEGGNIALHPDHGPERRDSLEPLTTSKRFRTHPIAPFRATSAATAAAARLGARVQAEYPGLWPETIRGLIVHSADWNATMLGGLDPHRPGVGPQVEGLLRRYGYGEPRPARAWASSRNEVTLFRQDELQPYAVSKGSVTINDCHIHRLNLPNELLESVGDTPCRMRVTLSSFTAPNPSASNRIPGSRYRYGGCLLRFRVRHRHESEANFLAQVSRAAEEEDSESLRDPAWALGRQLRNKGGSLVQDIWQGNAADLLTMNQIAVFPVKGWWAFRRFPTTSPWHHCYLRRIRYSLIISIEVMAEVPLYTEIQNLLSVPLDAA